MSWCSTRRPDLGVLISGSHRWRRVHAIDATLVTRRWAYDNALTRADDDLRDTAKMARGLAEGYEEYARALQAAGVETIAIAPVGAAFELVRAEDEALWRSLFARDGYHPSPVGTYLAARVLHETIATALNREAEITWDENVPADLADLADAARRACETHRPASSMCML